MNQIHDSVITTDLDRRVTGWNRRAERMFYYTEEESLGRHISFLYPDRQCQFL